MKTASITKVLKKVNLESSIYSLGFKRLTSLPKHLRQKINLSCVLKGESNDKSMQSFLGSLNDQEFINWLKNN
jgi:hypothetical protein